jgi:hypothetical protein
MMFADTGLLAHWGLRLDAPDERGPMSRQLAGGEVLTASSGALFGNSCEIGEDRLVAVCRIGRGRAIIIADADFLNVANLDGPTARNIDSLLKLLADLAKQ